MKTNTWIQNRFGEKLETIIHKPTDNGVYKTIVLVTGIGATLHETANSHDEIAQILCEEGFAVIQFSFAGRGESEGNYEEMTLTRQGVQVDDVLAWTMKQSFCEVSRIGVYAMSFGVTSALRSLLENISSLCLVSGAYYPSVSLKKLFESNGEYNPGGISWRRFRSGETLRFPPAFWQDLASFNVTNIASKITMPTICIHGEADEKTPCNDSKFFFDMIKSKKKRLKIFKGGDHGIIEVPPATREEFLNMVVEWFKETV